MLPGLNKKILQNPNKLFTCLNIWWDLEKKNKLQRVKNLNILQSFLGKVGSKSAANLPRSILFYFAEFYFAEYMPSGKSEWGLDIVE